MYKSVKKKKKRIHTHKSVGDKRDKRRPMLLVAFKWANGKACKISSHHQQTADHFISLHNFFCINRVLYLLLQIFFFKKSRRELNSHHQQTIGHFILFLSKEKFCNQNRRIPTINSRLNLSSTIYSSTNSATENKGKKRWV